MTDHRLRARLIAILLSVALVPGLAPAPAAASGAAPAQPGPERTGGQDPLLDAVPAPFTTTLSEPVAPGVDRTHGTWTTANGVQVVELLRADPAAPGITIDTSRPASGVSRLETVRSQAGRVSRDGRRVVAAVNGDVWMTDDATGAHAPIGVQIHNGELLTGSRVSHPTLGLDAAEVPRLGDVAVTPSVLLPRALTPLPVDRVNKPRRAGDLVVYSRRWAARTDTLAGGAEVVLSVAGLPLRPAGTWTGKVTVAASSAGDVAIPTSGLVLSADGADEAALRALRVGDAVTVSVGITAGWDVIAEAIGGREWLVEDAATSIRPVSSVTTSAHPRTAVGIDEQGRLLLATVDGRWPGYSTGVTAADLAGLLAQQGAVEAIMLDGGGSTTTLSRRPGDVEASVVNRPSDGRERPVDNALLVLSTTPTGPLADIVVRPPDLRLVVGQTATLIAKGVDAALNGVPLPSTGVTWSADGAAATLATTGRVRATTPGEVTVTALAAGLDATGRITVAPDTVAPVSATPVVRARSGATVNAGLVPVTISWAATDVGTGVASYEVRRRIDGGPLEAVTLPTPLTSSLSLTVPVDRAIQYQVRATDVAGNTGTWSAAGGFHLRLATESSASYGGRWAARTGTGYLGGAARSSGSTGATASFTFTGTGVAWIAAKSPTRGKARISVDGTVVATVDLRSSVTATRRVVWTRTWGSVGTHRITIRVLGTPGRPRIDVDGFAIVDTASIYPVLVGAGDIASCGYTADTATGRLIQRIPGAVFAAGDIAYDRGTAAQLANCYAPAWGRFRARTNPTPGNHDYLTPGAAPYFAYFGARAGTAGQGWYAYDVGTWRVYSLNSNCSAIGGCAADTAQMQWLASDLEANPRACVAAVWHHPLFSSGVHGPSSSMRPAWEILQAAGADLVLNGHDHDYERFAPQLPDGTASAAGIREFIVGTGGAGLRSFGTVRANSQLRKTGVHGVLKLELMTGSYRWTFVPVAGSTWTDTGTAACH